MTILDQMRNRVEEAREKIAARQRGEKVELKLPIINAMRANMEKRVKERKVLLRRGETPLPPPPPPPINEEKTATPSSQERPPAQSTKPSTSKIYV